jgi:hypothetical protein
LVLFMGVESPESKVESRKPHSLSF